MKLYFLTILISSLLILGCGGSKEAQLEMKLGNFNVSDCKNVTNISDPAEFMGETADNLIVTGLSKSLAVSFDVRTRCNAQLAADIEQEGSNIKIKLRNMQTQTVDCICFITITTSAINVAPGNYNVMITNSAGNQLLANKTVSVQ